MRSEEKENFRLVSPMMMAVICDYAEKRRKDSDSNRPKYC